MPPNNAKAEALGRKAKVSHIVADRVPCTVYHVARHCAANKTISDLCLVTDQSSFFQLAHSYQELLE